MDNGSIFSGTALKLYCGWTWFSTETAIGGWPESNAPEMGHLSATGELLINACPSSALLHQLKLAVCQLIQHLYSSSLLVLLLHHL